MRLLISVPSIRVEWYDPPGEFLDFIGLSVYPDKHSDVEIDRE
jgi:hypothetical protein